MKTENTLRTARNSLLCIFTALAASFLVACGSDGGGGFGAGGGGGGGGGDPFSAYLVDAPVEGAEYSGPTNLVKDTTRKDGEFEASEGVFEFSVGATTLGSVQLNSDWANSQVTPADFMGTNDLRVVSVARIVQGLDNDGMPENGISISQSVRDGLITVDLFTRLTGDEEISVTLSALTLTIPAESVARNHLIATRQCLFSGGYMGDYRSTLASTPSEVGEDHFVLEPIASDRIRLRGVEFEILDGSRVGIALEGPQDSAAVGVIGNKFFDGAGNEVTFVTPSLVTGIWTDRAIEGDPNSAITDSGTFRLTRVAGDPTANRRVVGVETQTSTSGGETTITPVGVYALNRSDDGRFSGQYYDVETDQYSVLLLTVADGAWPTASDGDEATAQLTLTGTLGGEGTTVTIQVTRSSDTIGTFEGRVVTDPPSTSTLGGSWCDLRATTTASVISSGVLVESIAMSHSRIGGDVSAHRLSRYLDSGFPANTAIDGVQILG